jgi:hypothetical protein
MKILHGAEPFVFDPWWVGMVDTCRKCECVYRMERGDTPEPDKEHASFVVWAKCPRCGAENGIVRDLK